MDWSAAHARGSGTLHYCQMTYLVTYDMNQSPMGNGCDRLHWRGHCASC